jgi:hypothetical protein
VGAIDGEEAGGGDEWASFRCQQVYTWKGGEGIDGVIKTGTGYRISWGSKDGVVDLA